MDLEEDRSNSITHDFTQRNGHLVPGGDAPSSLTRNGLSNVHTDTTTFDTDTHTQKETTGVHHVSGSGVVVAPVTQVFRDRRCSTQDGTNGVHDTGSNKGILTAKLLQRGKENGPSNRTQRHQGRHQRVLVAVEMQGFVHPNLGTTDKRLIKTGKDTGGSSENTKNGDHFVWVDVERELKSLQVGHESTGLFFSFTHGSVLGKLTIEIKVFTELQPFVVFVFWLGTFVKGVVCFSKHLRCLFNGICRHVVVVVIS